jgi:Terminase large subunit, T4likevirus-type, N-terminal
MDLGTETALRLDPSLLMEMAGFATVDPWQRQLLRSRDERVLLCSSRQLGKSTATAVCALVQAYLYPGSLVLLISTSKDQAIELFRKVSSIHGKLQLVSETKQLTDYLELANGSRLIALPALADSVRGYSAASLVVIDECSRVTDDVWTAVLPTVISSRGRVIGLSTPAGKSGRFYELWIDPTNSWLKIMARAADSIRISPEALAQIRQDIGPRRFRNEIGNEFLADVDSYFSSDAIDQILERVPSDRALIGVDLEDV